jgi:preprotein translocase subunit SecB
MADKAVFSLNSYHFNRVVLNLDNLSPEATLDMNFAPSGLFNQAKRTFLLSFAFKATCNNKDIVFVNCIAEFEFKDDLTFEEIPEFFYGNSIAILFPYIRSMVSTVTLQANVQPMILPTLNLVSLKDHLKAYSKVLNG